MLVRLGIHHVVPLSVAALASPPHRLQQHERERTVGVELSVDQRRAVGAIDLQPLVYY